MKSGKKKPPLSLTRSDNSAAEAERGGVITGESDVEAVVGDGEVRDEPELSFEVAIETGVDVAGQLAAGEAGQRLQEAAVLGEQQVVVLVLQVEGVELELDPCSGGQKHATWTSACVPVCVCV